MQVVNLTLLHIFRSCLYWIGYCVTNNKHTGCSFTFLLIFNWLLKTELLWSNLILSYLQQKDLISFCFFALYSHHRNIDFICCKETMPSGDDWFDLMLKPRANSQWHFVFTVTCSLFLSQCHKNQKQHWNCPPLCFPACSFGTVRTVTLAFKREYNTLRKVCCWYSLVCF